MSHKWCSGSIKDSFVHIPETQKPLQNPQLLLFIIFIQKTLNSQPNCVCTVYPRSVALWTSEKWCLNVCESQCKWHFLKGFQGSVYVCLSVCDFLVTLVLPTVSLAIADMMVGVLVVPFSVYTEISLMVTSSPPIWYQGGSTPSSPLSLGGLTAPWQPCMLIGPVFAGCTFVSISTIFLMTVERCIAILRPLHKDALVTRRRTLLLILLSWDRKSVV